MSDADVMREAFLALERIRVGLERAEAALAAHHRLVADAYHEGYQRGFADSDNARGDEWQHTAWQARDAL